MILRSDIHESVSSPEGLFSRPVSSEDIEFLRDEIKKIKKETRFQVPALFRGNKTATEYDSRVTNFSTQTKIVELPSGRKLFLVVNYATSTLHRFLDTVMKYLTGCKMSKAKSKNWKKQFESKSQIPTIPNEEDNLVILDYISNVNLYDLYFNQDKIEDWGECDFAKDISEDDLSIITDNIVDKVKYIHGKNTAWGELILPNMIIDNKQNVHICDPEVSYSKDVSLTEQKARDLFDLINSISAVMKQKHNIGYSETVERIIDRYENTEILSELKKLTEKKPGFINKLFFGYTQVRLGLKSMKEYEAIRRGILLRLSE